MSDVLQKMTAAAQGWRFGRFVVVLLAMMLDRVPEIFGKARRAV